ncbi:hypothetical protein Tco_0369760 [Tanacetum coccineum]
MDKKERLREKRGQAAVGGRSAEDLEFSCGVDESEVDEVVVNEPQFDEVVASDPQVDEVHVDDVHVDDA